MDQQTIVGFAGDNLHNDFDPETVVPTTRTSVIGVMRR
jgi:hypothetical protein